MSKEVVLKVYDLTRGMAARMSPMLLGTRIEGVWHTGILVFGKEYFYGGGIQIMDPHEVERSIDLKPLKQLSLGNTSLSQTQLEEYLMSISDDFSDDKYEVLHHNCNHFTDTACQFLLGKGIPHEILNQHEEIAKTPMGGMIIQLLQGFQQTLNAQGHGITKLNLTTEGPERLDFGTSPFGAAMKKIVETETLSRPAKDDLINTLLALTDNILNNAGIEKYLTVQSTNSAVQSKILSTRMGEDALVALGFTKSVGKQPETFTHRLPNQEDIVRLQANKKLLTACRKNLNQSSSWRLPFGMGGNSPSAFPSFSPASSAPPSQMPPADEFSFQLNQLLDMGFTNLETLKEVLKQVGGNLNQAIDKLLQN